MRLRSRVMNLLDRAVPMRDRNKTCMPLRKWKPPAAAPHRQKSIPKSIIIVFTCNYRDGNCMRECIDLLEHVQQLGQSQAPRQLPFYPIFERGRCFAREAREQWVRSGEAGPPRTRMRPGRRSFARPAFGSPPMLRATRCRGAPPSWPGIPLVARNRRSTGMCSSLRSRYQ